MCVLYVRKKAISGNARKKYYDCASVCSIIRVIAVAASDKIELIETAANGKQALERLDTARPDVLLLDELLVIVANHNPNFHEFKLLFLCRIYDNYSIIPVLLTTCACARFFKSSL